MEHLRNFLKKETCMAVATQGSDLWICNVYYGIDDELRIFFISPNDAKHSQHILENPTVAFNVVWHHPENHLDRKGVQGIGNCHLATDAEEIAFGVSVHNQRFPEFAERITTDYIKSEENESAVWVITPKKVQYYDDSLGPENKTQLFTFSLCQKPPN